MYCIAFDSIANFEHISAADLKTPYPDRYIFVRDTLRCILDFIPAAIAADYDQIGGWPVFASSLERTQTDQNRTRIMLSLTA